MKLIKVGEILKRHQTIPEFGKKGSPHMAHSLKSWTEGIVHMEKQIKKKK